MNTYSLPAVCFCSLFPLVSAAIWGAPPELPELQLDADSGSGVELSRKTNGAISIRTIDNDPQVVFSVAEAGLEQEAAHMLAFEYFCPDGVNRVELFYQRPGDRTWSEDRSVEGGSMPKAEGWQPYAIDLKMGSKGKWIPAVDRYRLDFGSAPGLQLSIRNVHLRAPTPEELLSLDEREAILEQKGAKAKAIDAFLQRDDFAVTISGITAARDHLILSGTRKPDAPRKAYLVEIEPHETGWKDDAGTSLVPVELTPNFTFRIPRFDGDRDRIANRYTFATSAGDKRRLLAHPHWVDATGGATERAMPRLRPANKKGLAGFGYKAGIYDEDLKELGIASATVNLPLGGLLNPSPGNAIHFTHQGRDWRFSASAVQAFDRDIRLLTKKNIVVSAILLVNNTAGVLVHPDYDPAGIYSMANLSSREGADAYRALIAFLAERYSRPNKEFGWISHWIVFNEVDYGWVWTNMGEQPMPVYLDTYHRALRLTWLEASRYNPTAEVFISLTHSWDYEPADSFRTYAPRAQLDRLARYSEMAGDFHWGVAYHPYPQSLLQPRTWKDRNAQASFDARFITPKNIEVLDAYLHQPEFLYRGELRTVLLSEQGFHTPDYSPGSMRDKAAAIAYTWAKILPLKTIESFHYHRWVDHPGEGGLKVGLRTLPTEEHPFGLRKEPAFSVFSALETEGQKEAMQPWLDYLDIDDWEDVRIQAHDIQR